MKQLLAVWFLLFFLPFPAFAGEISGIKIEQVEGGEHVTLKLTEQASYKVFRVEVPPPRIAVDLQNTQPQTKLTLPENYHGSLIRAVRFGFHDQTTGRVVFDLAEDAQPQHIQMMRKGADYWLEFDLAYLQSNKTPEIKSNKHSTVTSSAKPKHDTKPVIVIDAGHGGQDPGTSGRDGAEEKDFTLRYALALRAALLKTGHYHVTLTRSDDRYLFLRERVRRARKAHGDLFISLHADSAPTRFARGLSVYTISEKSSDKESEALAAQENRADVIGGMDLSGASDDVAGILIDLAERETRTKSAEFADLAIKYLGPQVGLLSNTHRFAGFAVLKAPDIPSVLVEIGFLTNPQEEHQLKSRSYETKVVHGLTEAVEEYFGKRR